ncbi:winged helix-turn-helix domain-containing protein [Croceicoccus ponticola]|uniref:winged helix-turn-helix domain-containing protein n=1 Tax=Croceicoccus ponticola TaxID=2217664 RepID=UPI0013E2E50D|nr:winged helix-turn-helix domain-containing protein [Croceicoccus ponticola]
MADESPSRIEGSADHRPDVHLLAHRADFRLGEAKIRPSVRMVEGPDGKVAVEPRVMQVLLALADAQGAVLTRDDLLEICWQGRIVGDDAVNRTISAVRRIATETAAGFEVETIPRIGYRLSIDTIETGQSPRKLTRHHLSRRAVIASTGALAFVGASGGWLWTRSNQGREYAARIKEARRTLSGSDGHRAAVPMLEKLVAHDPTRAEGWGLLAHARYREGELAPKEFTASSIDRSEAAARKALAIDPQQTDALFAQALLRSGLDDWFVTERRLHHVLELAPRHVGALGVLTIMLQSVGRCTESRAMLERAAAIEPANPSLQFKRALKFWIFGEIDRADRTIDRARQLWPRDEWVWSARLMIYAFTGRPKAALAMIDTVAGWPATLQATTATVWRKGLLALDSRNPDDIAGARIAVLDSAPKGPSNAGNGVMLLSALGQLDAAFAVTDSLLLRRGKYIDDPRVSNDGRLINSEGWRRTQWLFIPATEALRGDPRFVTLCRDLGLIDYWRKSGQQPDAFIRGALPAKF